MWNNFAILDLSTPDLLIILAIIVLLFGGKKLPELARSIGTSAKELREGLQPTETKAAVAEATDGTEVVTPLNAADAVPTPVAQVQRVIPASNRPIGRIVRRMPFRIQ